MPPIIGAIGLMPWGIPCKKKKKGVCETNFLELSICLRCDTNEIKSGANKKNFFKLMVNLPSMVSMSLKLTKYYKDYASLMKL